MRFIVDLKAYLDLAIPHQYIFVGEILGPEIPTFIIQYTVLLIIGNCLIYSVFLAIMTDYAHTL